jgi:hypothetical protein
VHPSDDFLESNMARLIKAGMSGEARLDPELRESMGRRLAGEGNARAATAPFPEKALGLLTAFGVLAILGVLAQLNQVGVNTFENGYWLILALLLLFNLALTPVASVVIIARRRQHDQAN